MDKLIIKINDTGSIKGVLTGSSNITSKLVDSNVLNGLINANPTIKGFITDAGSIKYTASIATSSSVPVYTGTYEVTPRTVPQSLQTANRVLNKNVSVDKIPYYETSNEYGETVYIG